LVQYFLDAVFLYGVADLIAVAYPPPFVPEPDPKIPFSVFFSLFWFLGRVALVFSPVPGSFFGAGCAWASVETSLSRFKSAASSPTFFLRAGRSRFPPPLVPRPSGDPPLAFVFVGDRLSPQSSLWY